MQEVPAVYVTNPDKIIQALNDLRLNTLDAATATKIQHYRFKKLLIKPAVVLETTAKSLIRVLGDGTVTLKETAR